MSSKHKGEDYKKSAVEYYLLGDKSQIEVCNIFKCNPRSLMRWVNKYKRDGEIKRQNRQPIAYKVRKEHVKFILQQLKQNKNITIEDILVKLKENYPDIDLSKMTIHRIIKNNNITLKLTRFRHEPNKRFGKDIDIKSKINDFYKEIKQYELNDIICIDETTINSLQKRHFCYSEIGKRCIIKTQSQDVFKKYSSIFAITTNSVIGWDIYEKGSIDSDRLYDFLEKNITSKCKNKIIVLDNAGTHRCQKIKDLINENNKLIYSVPYQHYTNSIENFFSMLKSRLQKMEGLRYNELKTNITKVVNEIPIEKYKNIFNGTYKRQKVYIPNNKIRKKPLKKYL
jgi:transposase